MTREDEIRARYEKELSDMRREQSECNHDWDEVKYDPEIKNIPQYRDAFKGSDYMPELISFTEKKVVRWSRTCKKCGKVEYTKKQKAVKYEPDFN